MQKGWWVFASVLLLGLFAFYHSYYANTAAFDALYRDTVAGNIYALAPQKRGFLVAVELDNHRRYRFFPAKQQGGAAGFLAAAAVGDSLQKKPNSDTLVLSKHGHKVRYVFRKVLY